MVVNQWVPAAHRGDAVGDSARGMRDLLRRQGYEADVFALSIDADLRDEVRPFTDPAARRGDVTVLHFAVPSPMTAALATLRGRRVLQYHNVTPAHFFAPYDAGIFRIAALGRTELRTLVGRVDLALGDSEYNRKELEALGFADTGVLPILVDTERITMAPRRPVLERTLDDGPANILFVGRVARTRSSKTTSGWPSTTSATSIPTIASYSSAGPTRFRATTRCCSPSSQSTTCRPNGSFLPVRCPTRSLPPTTAWRAPMSR